MNIVITEDHQDLRELILSHLAQEGFAVDGASCGEELDEILVKKPVSLLILDINLPGESGFDIAKRIRTAFPAMAIIMLTAQAEMQDRIQGYDSGADIYLAKPVSTAELTAAIKAIERRLELSMNDADQLVLSMPRMALISGTDEITISKADSVLLKALAVAPEHRLPYWRLFEVTERSLDIKQCKAQLEW